MRVFFCVIEYKKIIELSLFNLASFRGDMAKNIKMFIRNHLKVGRRKGLISAKNTIAIVSIFLRVK
jgi:hypothetical protein